MSDDGVFVPIPENWAEMTAGEKDAVVEMLLIGLAAELGLPGWKDAPDGEPPERAAPPT